MWVQEKSSFHELYLIHKVYIQIQGRGEQQFASVNGRVSERESQRGGSPTAKQGSAAKCDGVEVSSRLMWVQLRL